MEVVEIISVFGSRYQATASEDVDQEDLRCAAFAGRCIERLK
jgi:hypothetical protein